MVYYPNLLNNKVPSAEKEAKQHKIKKIIKIALGVVVILAVGGTGYFFYRTNYLISKISTGESSIIENVNHFLSIGKKDALEGEEDGRVNVLLLGMRGADDPHGGLLADSIMVVSIKFKKEKCNEELDFKCFNFDKEPIPEKVALISIPRDMFVDISGYNGLHKLNSIHALGEKAEKDKGGLKLMKEAVSNITGLPVHYGISIDFAGFKDVIDSLDGIEVNVPNNFYDPNYDGGISVKAGRQKMDSTTALKYAQARLTSNDFDRARRQQLILVGIKEKAMSKNVLSNPIKVLSTLDSVGKHLKTDMELWEIKRFMELSGDMNNDEKTIHKVFDTSPEGLLYSTNINGAYALRPKGDTFDKIKEVCKNIFEL